METFRQNADITGLARNTKLERRADLALAIIIGLALACAAVVGLAS